MSEPDKVVGPLGDPPSHQTKDELIIRLMQENGDLRLQVYTLATEKRSIHYIVSISEMHSLNTLVAHGSTRAIQEEAEAAIVRTLRAL